MIEAKASCAPRLFGEIAAILTGRLLRRTVCKFSDTDTLYSASVSGFGVAHFDVVGRFNAASSDGGSGTWVAYA